MSKQKKPDFGKLFDQDFDTMLAEVLQPHKQVSMLPVKLITPSPYQPRKYFDNEKIKQLAVSIASNGLLQPITVIKQNQQYVLVSGERRLKATIMLKHKTIEAIIMNLNAIEHCQASLVENMQREDLSVIEEALSYHNLLRLMKMDHRQLAQKVGRSRSYITNSLRLLQLTSYIQEQLIAHKISSTKARALIVISKQNPATANELCDKIIKNNWTNAMIAEYLTPKDMWQHLKTTEQQLRNQHLNIRIDNKKIVVHYNKHNWRKIIAFLQTYHDDEV